MIITHGDLDGLVSALIAMEITGQNPRDVHFFSYAPDRDKQWKSLLLPVIENSIFNRDVWFVDMSLRPGELEWARREKGVHGKQHWAWVDHHETSLEFSPEGIFDDVHLDTSGERCAAEVLLNIYCHKFGATKQLSHLEDWVMVAHERSMKLDMILKAKIRAGGEFLRRFLSSCQTYSPEQIIAKYQLSERQLV